MKRYKVFCILLSMSFFGTVYGEIAGSNWLSAYCSDGSCGNKEALIEYIVKRGASIRATVHSCPDKKSEHLTVLCKKTKVVSGEVACVGIAPLIEHGEDGFSLRFIPDAPDADSYAYNLILVDTTGKFQQGKTTLRGQTSVQPSTKMCVTDWYISP